MKQSPKKRSTERIDEHEKGLHVTHEHRYLSSDRSDHWWRVITDRTAWHRVRYKSGRFGTECETPCWTAFFGGREEYAPYDPVPDWLRPLVDAVSSDVGVPFNAFLLRLYFDGSDEIAWHTDGRSFLGGRPTIAGLSLGADASFQMRRMTNVWPPVDGSQSEGSGVDRATPQREFVVGDGDLFVMRGPTQSKWHHRVPKEKGRRPRLNINFRYILDGADAERGQKTYYKYMVHGDEENPRSLTYRDIMVKRGGLMNFFGKGVAVKRTASSGGRGKDEGRRENDNKGGEYVAPRDEEEKDEEVDSEAGYFASEGVDASTFRDLPVDVRRELLDEWRSRRRRQQQPKRPVWERARAPAAAVAPMGVPKKRLRTGTNKGNISSGTIKAFFGGK